MEVGLYVFLVTWLKQRLAEKFESSQRIGFNVVLDIAWFIYLFIESYAGDMRVITAKFCKFNYQLNSF